MKHEVKQRLGNLKVWRHVQTKVLWFSQWCLDKIHNKHLVTQLVPNGRRFSSRQEKSKHWSKTVVIFIIHSQSTYKEHLYLFLQFSNQPIKWQQRNVYICSDTGQEHLMFTNIRVGKNVDLCDLNHGMLVDARQACLRISITADLLMFSHIAVSKVYTKWCKKCKKHPVSSSSFSENAWLMREVRGERADCFELMRAIVTVTTF